MHECREFMNKAGEIVQGIRVGAGWDSERLVIRGGKPMSVSPKAFWNAKLCELSDVETFHAEYVKYLGENNSRYDKNLEVYGEMWGRLTGEDTILDTRGTVRMFNESMADIGYVLEEYEDGIEGMALIQMHISKTIEPDEKMKRAVLKLQVLGIQVSKETVKEDMQRVMHSSGFISKTVNTLAHKIEVDSGGYVRHGFEVNQPILKSRQYVEWVVNSLRSGFTKGGGNK